jgi:hypothetical protein
MDLLLLIQMVVSLMTHAQVDPQDLLWSCHWHCLFPQKLSVSHGYPADAKKQYRKLRLQLQLQLLAVRSERNKTKTLLTPSRWSGVSMSEYLLIMWNNNLHSLNGDRFSYPSQTRGQFDYTNN